MTTGDDQPQPWDPQKVAIAFAQIEGLVLQLGADRTSDAYRAELARVLSEVFPDDVTLTQEEVADRLADLIYGASIFGLAALTTAEQFSGKSRAEILKLLGSSLDTWLSENP